MPQAASQAELAYDWELWIGRTVAETTTWTQIYGFESLPMPSQVPEEIDVTHLNSPGRTREKIPGLIDSVDWSQDKQLWGDVGDDLLEELYELTASGDQEIILMEFNTAPDGSGYRRTYRGYVNDFTPTGSVGDKAMATVAFKVFDRQAINTRTIPAPTP